MDDTLFGTPGKRRWRSRAFVNPLLVTVVGVASSVVLYLSVTWSAIGSSELACPYGPDACGYVFLGRLGQHIAHLPALLIGLMITGLVVGLSSHDSRLAFRAIVVGTLLTLLVGGAVQVRPDAIADGQEVPFRIASILALSAFIGLALLIPVALGFGLGRAARWIAKGPSGVTGPQ